MAALFQRGEYHSSESRTATDSPGSSATAGALGTLPPRPKLITGEEYPDVRGGAVRRDTHVTARAPGAAGGRERDVVGRQQGGV